MPRGVDELDEVRVVVEAAVEVAVQLVTADVVQRLLLGAVLVDLPGEEVIDACGPRGWCRPADRVRLLRGSGKTSSRLFSRAGVRVFVGVVERAVGVAWPASASACWSRCRWSQRVKITRPKLSTIGVKAPDGEWFSRSRSPVARIEAPEPGRRRRFLVLVELRVEVRARRRAGGRR